MAVKPLWGWAATVREVPNSYLGIYTSRLSVPDALELADTVALAPVILQPYIHKTHELRITVVADQVFACQIDSQSSERSATDWRRYDLTNTPYSAVGIEQELREQIGAFMVKAGLIFAAFDFIVDTQGCIKFVEVNPAGQFGWVEELTGLTISHAICDWLVGR